MSQRKKARQGDRPGRTPNRGANLRKGILWAGVVVLVIGGSIWLAVELSRPELPPPPELEGVETFPDMGVQHLADGAPAPEYNSNPPTSGPHAQTPAPCGVYRQPVSDVSQLHSMEHGAVVVQYDPSLPPDQVALLENINWSPAAEVIVAPRPGNPAPVALTAWTRRLLLDEVDVEVVTAFQREFGNRSPEGAAQCPMQIDETR